MKIIWSVFVVLVFILARGDALSRKVPPKYGRAMVGNPQFSWNPFCNWPKPYTLDKVQPTFLVRYRNGQQAFNITNNDQIQDMVTRIHQEGLIKNRVLFVIHGYQNNIDTPWLYTTSDALLSVEDDTVIVIGWGKGADLVNYLQAASNTQTVSAAVALAAKKLKEIASPYTYCIGHSLGAHTCGQAGKIFKFDRISGLDPAGPGFESCPLNPGLSNVSADCVDVIHTNGEYDGYGTIFPLGHIDFYADCGKIQPGCWPVDPFGCSHGKAIDYFVESVNQFGMNPPLLPAAQGPCSDSLINSCIPCSDHSCPTQPTCKSDPGLAQPIGYGSVCSNIKVRNCCPGPREDYFGKWFVPVTKDGFPHFCPSSNRLPGSSIFFEKLSA